MKNQLLAEGFQELEPGVYVGEGVVSERRISKHGKILSTQEYLPILTFDRTGTITAAEAAQYLKTRVCQEVYGFDTITDHFDWKKFKHTLPESLIRREIRRLPDRLKEKLVDGDQALFREIAGYHELPIKIRDLEWEVNLAYGFMVKDEVVNIFRQQRPRGVVWYQRHLNRAINKGCYRGIQWQLALDCTMNETLQCEVPAYDHILDPEEHDDVYINVRDVGVMERFPEHMSNWYPIVVEHARIFPDDAGFIIRYCAWKVLQQLNKNAKIFG
ncbi:MAG: hypothetical protein Q7R96_05575 [Nanoarchaeota archaeon]|nr:hypothetical protein [Nanoarchaeota archaeon]